MADTQRMQIDGLARGGAESAERILLTDIDFNGRNGEIYHIKPRMHGRGGESQVYDAIRASDGTQVVARISLKIPGEDNKRNRICQFLYDNGVHYKRTGIMPLYDNGDIEITKNNVIYTYNIDILPLCEPIEQKCEFKKLKNAVIPSILLALKCMHDADIVHRDIKPGNIFYFDRAIVLGDFGIAGIVDDNNLSVGVTSRHSGTNGYTAPEVNNSIYQKASDYYSFGWTIAALYNGGHPCINALYETTLISYGMRQLPIETKAGEESIKALITSLIEGYPDRRAGYEDVQRWCRNPDNYQFRPDSHNTISYSRENGNFRFMNKIYESETELITALNANWEAGRRYMFSGSNNAGNNALLRDVTSSRHPCEDYVRRVLEDRAGCSRTQEEQMKYDNLEFAKFLNELATYDIAGAVWPIYWEGYEFRSFEEISVAMYRADDDNERLKRMLSSGILSYVIENKAGGSRETVRLIKVTESYADRYFGLARNIIALRLSDNARELRLVNPDSVFREMTKSAISFYCNMKAAVVSDATLAKFIFAGNERNVFAVKNNLVGSEEMFCSDVTQIYRLFENSCNNKSAVRKHFYEYGPYSYLTWFKNHTDKIFRRNDELREDIQCAANTKLSEDMSIDELISRFKTLKNIKDRIARKTLDNWIWTYLDVPGLDEGSSVYISDDDYTFTVRFLGNEVQRSYVEYMSMTDGDIRPEESASIRMIYPR